MTPGVVTPNIETAINGLLASAWAWTCARPLAMPAAALAALPSTCLEMLLSPAMSVTALAMSMSEWPTYGRVLLEAIVLTISLGKPSRGS